MAETIKWIKPSGVEVETNDMPATIAACEALEWHRADAPKIKRTRKAKADK